MIEDAVKIVKNHYALGEILTGDKLHGGFGNLTLSSQWEREGKFRIYRTRFPHNLWPDISAVESDMNLKSYKSSQTFIIGIVIKTLRSH